MTDGVATLDGLTIQAGSGSVAVSGKAGETLDLSLRLNALPAALVNNFAAGLDADGTIGGTVTVKGKATAPVVNYALDWKGAVTSQTRGAGIGVLDINAKGEFANNQVRLDTVLSGDGGLSFHGGGTVGIGGATPLGLKFNGTVPFGILQGQLSAQGFVLTGNATVDLAIGGTAAAVYQAHYEQQARGATDAKVWIAKATGLPLRTDVSLQAGQKVSVVTTFDYDHITAPPVD